MIKEKEVKKTNKELVQELKDFLVNSDYKRMELHTEEGMMFNNDEEELVKVYSENDIVVGTVYLAEGSEKGFDIYFVAEPNATPISGVDGIVTRIKMSFVDKTAFVERNLKEVSFSPRNIQAVFSYMSLKEFDELIADEQYPSMLSDLKVIIDYYYGTRTVKGRDNDSDYRPMSNTDFFYNIIDKYGAHEVLYKSGLNLRAVVEEQKCGQIYNSHVLFDLTKKKPHQILQVSKSDLQRIKKLSLNRKKQIFVTRTYVDSSSKMYGAVSYEDIVQNIRKFIPETMNTFLDCLYAVENEEMENHLENLDNQYSLDLKGKAMADIRPLRRKWSDIYNDATCFLYEKELTNLEEKWSYLMTKKITQTVTSSFLKFCKRYNLDIERAIEYIFYETKVRQGILSEHIAQYLLEDYYNMQSALLGIEYISSRNIDKYPKSLKLSHDIASYHHTLVKRELDSAKWKTIVPEMKKLEWTGKEYSVLIPEEPSLLVREGASLNHCVGSYVDSVMSQKTNIVFLRSNKDLDKPLVTLEVKALGEGKLTLRQAYGNSNSVPTSEQKQAIREYVKRKNIELSPSVI